MNEYNVFAWCPACITHVHNKRSGKYLICEQGHRHLAGRAIAQTDHVGGGGNASTGEVDIPILSVVST